YKSVCNKKSDENGENNQQISFHNLFRPLTMLNFYFSLIRHFFSLPFKTVKLRLPSGKKIAKAQKTPLNLLRRVFQQFH
ncbi:hypothetical protein OSK38_27945, partial [Escherichia coli]|nr:hypothetical protein [Escherichia coli]